MKRKILLATIIPLMTVSATAVVGGPNASEGEMTIQGHGSTASGTVAVGPNGTEYQSSVKMDGRLSQLNNDSVENESFSENEHKVEFEGYIQAPTPCHTLQSEVNETDTGYLMNIKTSIDDTDLGSGSACIQQAVTIRYDAEFSTQENFTLEVRHDNQPVETLEHPGVGTGGEGETGSDSGTNYISLIISILTRLF